MPRVFHRKICRPAGCTLSPTADAAKSLHHCTTAPLHHCTTAPLHHCTTAPLHHCTTAPLHPCTTAPLPHSTTESLHPRLTAPLCSGITATDAWPQLDQPPGRFQVSDLELRAASYEGYGSPHNSRPGLTREWLTQLNHALS